MAHHEPMNSAECKFPVDNRAQKRLLSFWNFFFFSYRSSKAELFCCSSSCLSSPRLTWSHIPLALLQISSVVVVVVVAITNSTLKMLKHCEMP